MRHLFIVNPTAGKGNRFDFLVKEIHTECARRGLVYEVFITTARGDAERVSRDRAAGDRSPLRIYVYGGDGTLSEVVNGVAGYDHCAVTVLPLGSGNDFLKLFGEDAALFRSLPTLLDDSVEHTLDLIECNGRYALNICSIGLDARIGLGMVNWKRLPLVRGTGAYVLSAIAEILQGIAKPMTVTVPGEAPVSAPYTLICVCNGRAYGGCFYPYPTAMPDDGVLDFIIVPKLAFSRVARMIFCYAAGDVERYAKYVRLYHGTALHIETPKPYRMELDGEELLDTSFSISLSANKLRFFSPRAASYATAGAKRKQSDESKTEKSGV